MESSVKDPIYNTVQLLYDAPHLDLQDGSIDSKNVGISGMDTYRDAVNLINKHLDIFKMFGIWLSTSSLTIRLNDKGVWYS